MRQDGGPHGGGGAEVEATVGGARELLDKLRRQGILAITDADGWPPRPALAGRKAPEHAGRALPAVAGRLFRRRGIGSCDWPHFLLALHLGAQVICTADKAFADAHGSDDEFGHIRAQLASGPLAGPLAGLGGVATPWRHTSGPPGRPAPRRARRSAPAPVAAGGT